MSLTPEVMQQTERHLWKPESLPSLRLNEECLPFRDGNIQVSTSLEQRMTPTALLDDFFPISVYLLDDPYYSRLRERVPFHHATMQEGEFCGVVSQSQDGTFEVTRTHKVPIWGKSLRVEIERLNPALAIPFLRCTLTIGKSVLSGRNILFDTENGWPVFIPWTFKDVPKRLKYPMESIRFPDSISPDGLRSVCVCFERLERL